MYASELCAYSCYAITHTYRRPVLSSTRRRSPDTHHGHSTASCLGCAGHATNIKLLRSSRGLCRWLNRISLSLPSQVPKCGQFQADIINGGIPPPFRLGPDSLLP